MIKIKPRKYIIASSENNAIECKLLKGYVALYVERDFWIISKGYTLYKYNPVTSEAELFAKLKDSKSALASRFRLTRRALRAEITHLYHFGHNWFCIARKAIFKLNSKTKTFEICRIIARGSRPMNLCQGEDGSIFYGEYFYNPEKKSVNIFQTQDQGLTWTKAYTFAEGEINHVHGIFNDPYSKGLWIFTGDDDAACIAGHSDNNFKSIEKCFSGKQEYRVCVPLFRDNDIIYATDSQFTPNSIRRINRKTLEIENLQSIQGSGIYAVDMHIGYAISTTVEPSSVNLDKRSHLWYSSDGDKWKEIVSFPKDNWKTTLFQFGSIRFPHYAVSSEYLIATGRALKTLDQSTLIIPISEIKQ